MPKLGRLHCIVGPHEIHRYFLLDPINRELYYLGNKPRIEDSYRIHGKTKVKVTTITVNGPCVLTLILDFQAPESEHSRVYGGGIRDYFKDLKQMALCIDRAFPSLSFDPERVTFRPQETLVERKLRKELFSRLKSQPSSIELLVPLLEDKFEESKLLSRLFGQPPYFYPFLKSTQNVYEKAKLVRGLFLFKELEPGYSKYDVDLIRAEHIFRNVLKGEDLRCWRRFYTEATQREKSFVDSFLHYQYGFCFLPLDIPSTREDFIKRGFEYLEY
jgi:hypothetical protein